MTTKKIDLSPYRGNKSTLYTGRPQGMDTRQTLGLDDIDKISDVDVVLEIPENTTSFNPSFYLGLLYKSYKTLGVVGFQNKYKFEIKTKDEETKKVILKNLEDGMRNAINEMSKKTGIWSFIKNNSK